MSKSTLQNTKNNDGTMTNNRGERSLTNYSKREVEDQPNRTNNEGKIQRIGIPKDERHNIEQEYQQNTDWRGDDQGTNKLEDRSRMQ